MDEQDLIVFEDNETLTEDEKEELFHGSKKQG